MIGTILNNRYQLDVAIAQGGMGTLYRATDRLLERTVAVKLVLPDKIGGTEGRIRLLQEARAVARLNHPNIVTLFDAGEATDDNGIVQAYLVMELVEGASLEEQPPKQGTSAAALTAILSTAQQICAGLAHAHGQGIVHRDIKPANILMDGAGHIKLTDFGLARSMRTKITREGGISGTVHYMAPEQALGQPVDGRTDLYALGVLLYQWTTGFLPFDADDPLSVISQHLYAPVVPACARRDGVPRSLSNLIDALLAKEPAERPASADAVSAQLATLLRADSRPATGAEGGSAPPTVSLLNRIIRGRMVGRESELAIARGLWREATEGAARVLLISGEPGIGKTRLVREIRTMVDVARGTVLAGEAYEEGTAPYAPLGQPLMRSLSQSDLGLPGSVLADLTNFAPGLRHHYPTLPVNPALEPDAERQRLYESFVAYLQLLLQQGPVLFILEDAHWADSGTLSVIRHAVRRLRQMPLFLVMSYREVALSTQLPFQRVLHDLNRERVTTRLKLRRFSPAQTSDMLSSMFGEPVSMDFTQVVYRETEGNPFFIEEVCKALIDEGIVYFENGRWERPAIDSMQIPQSLRSVVQVRLDKLEPAAQDLLRVAAVFGREFDFELLVAAAGWDEDAAIDALELAERAQIIQQRADGSAVTFTFAHGLIPTTLRESIGRLRLRRYHRAAAEAIAQLRPDDFEALAHHYLQAGDEEKAGAYLRQAGNRAAALFANSEAIRFYTEALELLEESDPVRFDVLARRAKVYDLLVDRAAQKADVVAMVESARASGDIGRRCDALLALAEYYLNTVHLKAREPAHKALELARTLDDPAREGRALSMLSYVAWLHHETDDAQAHGERAVQQFKSAGDLDGAAYALHHLSLVFNEKGEPKRSLEVAKEALQLTRDARNRRQEATALRRVGIAYKGLQQPDVALPYVEHALKLHRELEDRREQSADLNVLGLLHVDLGNMQAGAELLQASLRIAEETEHPVSLMIAANNWVYMHLLPNSDYEDALAFLETQEAQAASLGDDWLVAGLVRDRQNVLIDLGQFEAAGALWDEVGPVFVSPADGDVAGFEHFLRGHHAVLAGDAATARERLALAAAEADEAGASVLYYDALAWMMEVALLEDDAAQLQDAYEDGRRAFEFYRDLGKQQSICWSSSRLALLQLALGNVEEASSWVAIAVDYAHKLPPCYKHSITSAGYAQARVLLAQGNLAEAEAIARNLHVSVMQVADKLSDPALRHSWLENVRINRAIAQLALELSETVPA